MIRVLVADDQALVRGGICSILGKQPDLAVVGEANDGVDAVRLTAELHPDVVLMDIRMPRQDGLVATEQIMALTDPPRVVVLTTFDVDNYVYAALAAGASGFLLKDTPPERLADAVRDVAAGERLLSPGVTRRLIEAYVQAPPPVAGLPPALADSDDLPVAR